MLPHQHPSSVSTFADNSPYFDAVTVPDNPYFYPPCSNHLNSNPINLDNKLLTTLINQAMLTMLERMNILLQTAESKKLIDEVSEKNVELSD